MIYDDIYIYIFDNCKMDSQTTLLQGFSENLMWSITSRWMWSQEHLERVKKRIYPRNPIVNSRTYRIFCLIALEQRCYVYIYISSNTDTSFYPIVKHRVNRGSHASTSMVSATGGFRRGSRPQLLKGGSVYSKVAKTQRHFVVSMKQYAYV